MSGQAWFTGRNLQLFRCGLLCLLFLLDTIIMVIFMEIDYPAIGKRIANRRKQLGLKQNILAEKLNMSNNYLSGIERGNEKPSLEVLVKICNSLQVTPDYLLMGNMYSNIVPQNIINGLQLCTEEDILLLNAIMQHLVERRSKKWNSDNFT